jgi:hypothetical protein
VLDEDAECLVEVAAAEDEEPVQALDADRADEAFGVRVRPWRPDRCVYDGDAFASEDLVEGGAEFAVGVVDEVADAVEQAGEGRPSFSTSPAMRG